MKEPLFVKVAALSGSLLGFQIARQNKREIIPFMMIGGLLGGCIAEWAIPDNSQKESPNPKETTK